MKTIKKSDLEIVSYYVARCQHCEEYMEILSNIEDVDEEIVCWFCGTVHKVIQEA